MLHRNLCGVGLFVVLFSLFLVVGLRAQGIPSGSASTDTGLGGVNTISGTILVSTGGRIERRVSVRIQSMMSGDRITSSDEYGNFRLSGVPSGDYTIVIDKEKDFEPFSQRVSVIQPRGMPPQTYYLSVRLTYKLASTGKPGVIDAELAKIPKSALDLYNKGVELAKNGDRLGAIKQFQAAVAEYANFTIAYNELGVQYWRMNELTKADEALQAALKIDSNAFSPLMNRGMVLFTMKRYADAESVLRDALKIDEHAAVGHYFLGQALANQGKFVKAEKELLTAVRLGGADMKEAHRLLAIIYSSSGDKKGAADELETYLRLAPNTPDADNLRHVILQLKGLEAPPQKATTKPPQ